MNQVRREKMRGQLACIKIILNAGAKKSRLRNHVIHLLDRQDLSGIDQNLDRLGKFFGIIETSLGSHVLEHHPLDFHGVKLRGVLGQVHQNNIPVRGLDVSGHLPCRSCGCTDTPSHKSPS